MMLRCAACINSGSAFFMAFSAASRSPLLIASSTVRTAPRIWVRRDLLMMVRRAILRVAFLAEVVLAMFSTILRLSSLGWSGWSAPAVQMVMDVCLFGAWLQCVLEDLCVLEDAMHGSQNAFQPALLKEQRRRDCARRHWGSYRGRVLHRQRFPGFPGSRESGRKRGIRC